MKIKTTAEVWAVIRARHHEDLVVHSSYSYPDGNPNGNPNLCEMFTAYGFLDGEGPILSALTTWEKRPEEERRHDRYNEHHHYWLHYVQESED